MKYLKTREEFLADSKDEQEDPSLYIFIEIDTTIQLDEKLLLESKWVESSSEKGLVYRVDPAKNKTEKRHVHIAREQHKNSKNKQVSWNDDQTRHDKKSFDDNFVGMEKAKRLAREILGLPPEAILEQVVINKGNFPEGDVANQLLAGKLKFEKEGAEVFILRATLPPEKSGKKLLLG